jgi:hypothetical protein
MTSKSLLILLSFLAGSSLATAQEEATAGPSELQQLAATQNKVQVIAANDLGMHCVDRESSVYSILPPFNVIHAQAVWRRNGAMPVLLDDTHIELTYSAVPDLQSSRNSTSLSGKTDFWQHASALFGATLAPGESLTGFYMPADAPVVGPQLIPWNATHHFFEAFGIPITPIDDNGVENAYPLMRISAKHKTTGRILGFQDIVLPVSAETDCQNCHATGEIAAVDPGVNWSVETDLEIQTKRNVLKLHDFMETTDLEGNQPVLCASCHYSAALDLEGIGPTGEQLVNPTMSATMHGYHGALTDSQGQPIFPSGASAADSCYQCHPGQNTQCHRGAMADGGMECFSCHGDMNAVGGAREPWMDMPKCQSCHTGDAINHLNGANLNFAPDGIRLQQAWRNGDTTATPINAPNSRFKEENGTLYRFSKGHGDLACTACHGSPHATWPITPQRSNDNVAAYEVQGHTGTVIECDSCHTTDMGNTMQGPHGMHPVGQSYFLNDHSQIADNNLGLCKTCHGANLMGTVLSRAAKDRHLWDNRQNQWRDYTKGEMVACNKCHSIP